MALPWKPGGAHTAAVPLGGPRQRADWLAAAGDLLLGARCPGCDLPGWGLCPDCRTALAAAPCRLTRPDPCPVGFPVTATAGPYDVLAKRLVSAHKERQVLALTPVLGGRLLAAVTLLLADRRPLLPERGPVVLVPVPSSPAAVRAGASTPPGPWPGARHAAPARRPG